jgi:hypothetical protein
LVAFLFNCCCHCSCFELIRLWLLGWWLGWLLGLDTHILIVIIKIVAVVRRCDNLLEALAGLYWALGCHILISWRVHLFFKWWLRILILCVWIKIGVKIKIRIVIRLEGRIILAKGLEWLIVILVGLAKTDCVILFANLIGWALPCNFANACFWSSWRLDIFVLLRLQHLLEPIILLFRGPHSLRLCCCSIWLLGWLRWRNQIRITEGWWLAWA